MTLEELETFKNYAKKLGFSIIENEKGWGPNYKGMFVITFPNVSILNCVVDYTFDNKNLIRIAAYNEKLFNDSEFISCLNLFSLEDLKLSSLTNMIKKYMELRKQYEIDKKLEKIEQDF